MYSQTYTEPQDELNDLTEKDKTAQQVSFSTNEVAKVKSLELDKLYDLVNETFNPSWSSVNIAFGTQTLGILPTKRINISTCIWLSYTNELIVSPFLPVQRSEKRYSVEIVKRYSLSELVQKIYFSQVSYYVSIDIVVNSKNISDKQFETFFEYEKQLLNTLNLPMNFNYHLNNSFETHSENVLIFEK